MGDCCCSADIYGILVRVPIDVFGFSRGAGGRFRLGQGGKSRALKERVAAKDEDRLKSLAGKYNTTPIKLMTTILVEDNS
jgi:hypothetical protein